MAGRRLLGLLLALGLFLGAAAGLGILPEGRELEELALIRALGMDASGTGVAVTAASGEQRERGVRVNTAAGDTVSGACRSLRAKGEGDTFYGHTETLVLGEALAERGVSPALEHVFRDVELRLSTDLYLARGGTAEGVLSSEADGEDSVHRLETMARDAKLLPTSMVKTVGEVLRELSRSGAAAVPALRAGGDGTLAAAGYGILKGDSLAGWTDEKEAHGVNLALGQMEADVVEVPWGDGTAALRVVDARTKVRPVFKGGALSHLTIVCQVEANLAGGVPGLEPSDPAQRAELERLLAEAEGERLAAALALSRELDADFLELGVRAALAEVLRSRAVTEQFFPGKTPVISKVEAELSRGYDEKG